MQISPLTPTLGAEISGVDIRSLDVAGFAELRDIWLQYKVIFLRQQDINLDDLQHFSRHFGDLMQLPPVVREDEMNLLRQYYDSPYFFDARALKDAPPIPSAARPVPSHQEVAP